MDYINRIKNRDIFWVGFAIFVCLLLLFPLFKNYYISPNEHMYAFGGDALTLYYNVVYHTCYGEGNMLKNMNYPDGELIFLTDAQGALSCILNFINKYLFNVCDHVLGIIHSLQIISVIAGTILMYYLYKGLNVVQWRASIFSALTIAMSPQIARVIPHHGLSYAFILPMVLLWLLRKYNVQKFEKRDILVFGLILFFGFNNPYLCAISCFTILAFCLAKMLLNKKMDRQSIYTFIFGLIPLACIAIYFKLADPYDDRLQYQWGFYTYSSKLEGLFFTPGSLFDKLINAIGFPSFIVQFEACINLGFSITITLFAFLLIYIFRRKLLRGFVVPDYVRYIFLGSVIILLYSTNVIFAPFSKEKVEAYLGPLLMFKAVGRLGWTAWFSLVILAVVLIEQLLRRMAFSGYLYTIVLFVMLWALDFLVSYRPSFNGHEHDNIFKKANKDVIRQDLKNFGIDEKRYQAILSIPRLVGWSDAYLSENNFLNQFIPWKISAATGIPLLNGMYSRVSVGQIQERMQFYSHPLIEKNLHKKFPNSKPILLAYGKPNLKLSEGEQHLLSISKKIYEETDFAFYELSLDTINKYPLLQSLKRGVKPSENACSTCISKSFDDSPSPLYYAGGGSKTLNGGEVEYLNHTMPNILEDSLYEFSIWTHVDKSAFGSFKHFVYLLGADNKIISSHEIFGQNAADVHGEWSRSSVIMKVSPGNKIKAVLKSRMGYTVDELLIRPVSKNYIKDGPREVLFNGYKVIQE